MQWSHSSLKDFEGCPRRYHEVRILKKYPRKDTPATIYGNAVHKAIELYIKDGKPFVTAYQHHQPLADAMLAKPGRKMAEHQMAVTVELAPCEWFAPEAWVRGIADILVVDDDNLTAWVGDWKTGSNKYPDRDQLTLMSLLVFAHFPHIRKVNSALIFTLKNDIVKKKMLREEADVHWQLYRERTAKLAACMSNNVWNPKQSPLCPWCPVVSCEHHPEHHRS